MRLLNLRVDDELRALIEAAVQVSDAKDLSKWARDALEAGARKELAEAVRSLAPVPVRRLGIRGAVLIYPSGCQHPPQAQYHGVTNVTCLLCGVEVRRT